MAEWIGTQTHRQKLGSLKSATTFCFANCHFKPLTEFGAVQEAWLDVFFDVVILLARGQSNPHRVEPSQRPPPSCALGELRW
ncbi:hypothetical protein Y032_0040g322 [Ancylostoma ceylanicum]|uniref:Uncharacterized protein n=1 Tax=Ancylostoma ceylanicum TaxID=53326 RepID=A0A016UHK8_9BILA|nr:hypothetical protein Y032_0040g322 [Ancylostoma ceylanicum]